MITPEAIAAIIKAQLPPDLQREASGVYCLTNEKTVYSHDNDHHPVKLWFCNPAQRNAILNSSHTIAAVMYFDYQGNVKIISSPRLAMDDASRSVVVGHLGDFLSHPTPVSVLHDDITSNVMGFLPSTQHESYNGIMDNVPASERTDPIPNNDPPAADGEEPQVYRLPFIPTYDGEDVQAHQAALPKAIPLFYGHGLGDGNYDITQPDTLAMLRSHLADTLPILGDWIDAIHFLQTNYDSHGIQDTTKFPDHQRVLMPTTHDFQPTISTVHESVPGASNLATTIFGEIQRLSDANVLKWFESNQDDHPAIAATIQQLKGGTPGADSSTTTRALRNDVITVSTPASLDDKATERHKGRAAAMWSLLLSSPQDGVLVFPELSKPMQAAINEPTPSKAVPSLKRSIKEKIQRLKQDKSYLTQMTSFNTNIINVAFTTAFTTATFFDGNPNGDDDYLPIHKTFSLFSVLKARTSDKTYSAVVSETQAVAFEAQQSGIPSSKRTTPSSNLYTDGAQETYEDVLSAVANLIGILQWAVEENGQEEPTFIRDLKELFDLMTDDVFRQLFTRQTTTLPWIGHCFILEIQNLFQARAEMAMTDSNIEAVLDGSDIDATVLKLYDLRFSDVKDTFSKIIANSGRVSSVYAGEPVSYKLFRPDDHPVTKKRKTTDRQTPPPASRSHGSQGTQGSQGSQRRQSQGQPGAASTVLPSLREKGFLTATARITMYPTLSTNRQLCGNWAIVGKSCPYGHGCMNTHVTWPPTNNRDRQTIEQWVINTPGIEFSPVPDRRVTFQQPPPAGPPPARFQANTYQNNANGNGTNTNNRRQGTQGNQQRNTNGN